MANIFKVTLKRREAEAEKSPAPAKPSEESQPTMTQKEFFYGPEGMKRKPKGTPPASMNP